MKQRKIQNTICGLIAVASIGLGASHARATSFSFGPTSIEDGTVSATMDISIDGNVLTAIIDNTSPVTLDAGFTNSDGGTEHAPGITGFGFNVDPDDLDLVSWTLKGTDKDGDYVTIGSGSAGTGETWSMGTFTAGVTLDYLPDTDKGIKGALYNPAAAYSVALAAAPNYFTTAKLEMVFAAPPEEPASGYEAFVRMQNVGVNGEGSSKQFGSTDGSTTDGTGDGSTDGTTSDSSIPGAVPEPLTASLALVGLGALGCTVGRRR